MKKLNLIILLLILVSCQNVKAITDTEIESALNNLSSRVTTLENNNNFLKFHPVGSVYITTSSSENTAAKMSSLHGGTWVAYASGRSVVGIDTSNGLFNTVDKTGGASSVGLSANQIPSLTVTGTTNSTGNGYSMSYANLKRTTEDAGSHQHHFMINIQHVDGTYVGNQESLTTGLQVGGRRRYSDSTDYSGNHSHYYYDYYVNSISGVQSHAHSFTGYYTNNSKANVSVQDPYIVAYMWKRTA